MSRCADFNSWVGGTAAYTNHGVSANLNITGSLSIDAWVKLRQTSQSIRSVFCIRGAAGGGYYFAIYRNYVAGKNTLTFGKIGTGNFDSVVDIVNGTPVHIAVTWNTITGDIIFYRNGVAVETQNNAVALIASPADSFYADSSTTGQGVNGCVYSLNVYNRVLSLAEINYNKEHPADAIRRGRQLGVTQESWVGGVWKDLSPNAYDGTPTGVVLSPQTNIAGRNVTL